jgi:pimeloyl-ACP methyl ester carboxylesterase
MKPFHFAAAESPIFGVYHAPVSWSGKARAVVLCHSLGMEYMRSHRAFRQLAELLARQGWHVLRFDYHGTGDSASVSTGISLDTLKEDIALASRELSSISGVRRPALIGLRLGATLATLAVSEGLESDCLLLWDPVLKGDQYLREMEGMQEARLRHPHFPRKIKPSGEALELLGYEYSRAFLDELQGIDLYAVKSLPGQRSHLLDFEQRSVIRRPGFMVEEPVRPAQSDEAGVYGRWNDLNSAYNILQAGMAIQEISRLVI